MTPEWRIIVKALIEPGMGTGRPLPNCDLRKPVKLTRNVADTCRAVETNASSNYLYTPGEAMVPFSALPARRWFQPADGAIEATQI